MATHEVKIRIMKTVSAGTQEIVKKRVRKDDVEQLFQRNSALALVHGDVCEMIYASDLAQKTANVEVFEIPGSCPPAYDMSWDFGRCICGRGSGAKN